MNKALLQSNSQVWETPPEFFDYIHKCFDFTVDVCATDGNAKLPYFFSPEDDGLSKSWSGHRAWMNPPYAPKRKGNPGQIDWVRKAVSEVKDNGCELAVCLLPARTDTKLFHDYVMQASMVGFIKGRLKFVGAPSGAVFPSMLVVFQRSTFKMYSLGHQPQFITLSTTGRLIA